MCCRCSAPNYILNDEKLELKDVAIFDAEQDSLRELVEQQRSSRLLDTDTASDIQSQTAVHNTYMIEQEMLQLVRKAIQPH